MTTGSAAISRPIHPLEPSLRAGVACRVVRLVLGLIGLVRVSNRRLGIRLRCRVQTLREGFRREGRHRGCLRFAFELRIPGDFPTVVVRVEEVTRTSAHTRSRGRSVISAPASSDPSFTSPSSPLDATVWPMENSVNSTPVRRRSGFPRSDVEETGRVSTRWLTGRRRALFRVYSSTKTIRLETCLNPDYITGS